ncbi:slipin family protein [Streptomyces sp. TRM64462]|uniref:slipin family protein n=1 Tax=Streptomyces sp. TRM64462 TaxID=2741726 RepID=UPI001586A5D0|nr:slipin family protein [Streptomyces sp. TRM64462]
MGEELLTALVLSGIAVLAYVSAAAKVVKQYEQGVVLRFGRLRGRLRTPGFTMIIPGVDRMRKVSMQIVTMPVPAQEGITRDNVTVRVDAVVYFKVVDPVDAVIRVEDYRFAVAQIAQTSLRSIIGKSELDDLLSNREKLNQGLELMIDNPAVEWGVTIDRVEIKDVSLPETMKRSMARQAEADRERRARLINADAEFQASKKLSQAAREMSDTPAALQLRLLQTVMAVAAEKNSTLVLPIPVELLRFLERSAESAEHDIAEHEVAERDRAEQDRAEHELAAAPREAPAAEPAPRHETAAQRERAGARRRTAEPVVPPVREPAPTVPVRDDDAGTAGCL